MTRGSEEPLDFPLAAVESALCLGTREASTGKRHTPWPRGLWQLGFATVRVHGNAVRFKVHPGSAIREIRPTAVSRIDVMEGARSFLPFVRPTVLRVSWSAGGTQLVTGFVLDCTPASARRWEKILGALRAGIVPG